MERVKDVYYVWKKEILLEFYFVISFYIEFWLVGIYVINNLYIFLKYLVFKLIMCFMVMN